MIRKTISIFICFTLVLMFSCLNISYAYSASSYCLYDPVLKKVLASGNMHTKRAMASTTKIMTAYLACQLCDLDEIIKVTDKMIACEGSSVGLQVGDKISYKDLLYGLMLESGNDAALCIAIGVAGSEEAFSRLMNEKAKSIGMTNTNFVTSNGLDDESHYSTAYDMALLTGFAMENEMFCKIVSTKVYKANYNNGESVRTYYNHNRLLSSLEGCEGVKTGFTKKAGRCLVSSCNRSGVRLIAVTFNASDDWNDHKLLYNFGYKNYETVTLEYSSYYIDVVESSVKTIKAETLNKQIVFYQGLSSFIKQKAFLPKFVYSPIKKGEKVGYVLYYYKDSLIAKTDIVAAQSADKLEIKQEKFDLITMILKILVLK